MKSSFSSLRAVTSPRAPARTSFTAVLFLFLWLLSTAAAPAAAGHRTAWKLYDSNPIEVTTVARFAGGPYRMTCGSYGVFELSFDAPATPDSGESPDSARESGQELPPDYPLLSGEAPSGVYLSSGGGYWRSSRAGRPAPPPCDGGSCFSAPGRTPWVAVIDWDNWHGWTVGWTVLQSSAGAVKVALFPLDDPSLAVHFGDRITDVHLLAQLCRLADTVEQSGVTPPLAVNLSFGRPHSPKDATAGSCDPSTLSCQIEKVIDHLETRSLELAHGRVNPTVFIAAAGNHRKLLFPAAYSGVISAGALDLQVFHRRGQASPAWETPENADALFPGYGLCLEYTADRWYTAAWPVPPGSSFSTALMTGWLAPSLSRDRLPTTKGKWAPGRVCWRGRCSIQPARGGHAYGGTNSAAQKMVEETASDQQSDCSTTAPGTATVIERPTGSAVPLSVLPALSFPEVTPWLYRATPEPASCVPCEERLNRARNQNTLTVGTGESGLGVGSAASFQSAPQTLAVGLWDGQTLDSVLTLTGLYLRVETTLYPIELSRSDLDDLAAGKVDVLEIDLGASGLPKDSQPSLVWTLAGPSSGFGVVEFWTSTPILLRSS